MSVTQATANKEIGVRFRGIQKSYDGETLIVKDLNLDIEKGEFLTLLGPSGSGKTTSLMMLQKICRTNAILAWCFKITPCFLI